MIPKLVEIIGNLIINHKLFHMPFYFEPISTISFLFSFIDVNEKSYLPEP